MRLSIRHRLLLLIVATVVTVIAVHDIVAYRQVRRSTVAAATDRLTRVSAQLGEMFDTQMRQRRELVGTVARDSAITRFLGSGATSAERAMTVLQTIATPASIAAVELWDASGRTVLQTRRLTNPPSEEARRSTIATVAGSVQRAVGPMVQIGDSLVCAAIARVVAGTETLGYVVQWRHLTGSKQGRKQVVDLIGPGTEIYLGNTTGEGWTDFAEVIARPPVTLPSVAPFTYTRSGVGPHLAVGRPIAGAPWTLLVATPEASVRAPVNAMVRELALITTLLLAVGLLAAWVLGTRLTTPIGELAGAAAAISAGDYSRRVAADRTDELGVLGRAFNQMATSVGAAHAALQERSEELAERATQLSEQATELEMANEELASSVDEATRTRDELSVALNETARATAELNASLASAPVGFAFHDLNGRYRRVNDCLSTLDGVTADEHIGRLPSEVLPAFGPAIEDHVKQAITARGSISNVELFTDAITRATDARYWLASFYPIRTTEGELLGVGSVVTDLTAHKQLESQLLQSQKLEAVGRLAGGVAHDFNNILTAISGFGQFALSELGDDAEAARSDMEQVLAAAKRAGALTGQLLAFSRQQVLLPRVVDLNEIVSGVTPMLGRLIGEDIKLVSKGHGRLDSVKADPNQLEQVLVNLVVNARDAMPDGGTIIIETANVELDAHYAASHDGVTAGPHVMLAVTDTGVGMDAETRSRVFEPFFTTKDPTKGTGLGLSTVYGIVKQSGGALEVYSELAHGTTFKVYLPRSAEPKEARHTPPVNAVVVPNAMATVLLVDDDPFVAATARRALERIGYVVLVASNGREALELVERCDGALDLVITDLVMPEMGGRELARRLLVVRPSVRILFTSGYTAEAMNQQAVLQPSDAFLGKPFTPDGLLRQVQTILEPATLELPAPRQGLRLAWRR
jgi:PAS domain S-box-containing protein